MNAQTIRPARPAYGQYAVVAGVVLVIAVVFSLSEYPDAMPAIVGGTIAALAVGAGAVVLYFRNTTVVLEPGSVSHTNLLGITRHLPAGSVATVVRVVNFSVLVDLGTRSRRSDSQVFLLDASGATLLRLRSALWGLDALTAVRGAVPAATEISHGQMDPGTMKAAYPRALSFFESNPIVVGVLAALALLAVVVVVVVVNS